MLQPALNDIQAVADRILSLSFSRCFARTGERRSPPIKMFTTLYNLIPVTFN